MACTVRFCTPQLISAHDVWLSLAKHYFNNTGNQPWEGMNEKKEMNKRFR
ncbi:hypothetical protein LguiA_029929 [Lonicera macranthoides]